MHVRTYETMLRRRLTGVLKEQRTIPSIGRYSARAGKGIEVNRFCKVASILRGRLTSNPIRQVIKSIS